MAAARKGTRLRRADPGLAGMRMGLLCLASVAQPVLSEVQAVARMAVLLARRMLSTVRSAAQMARRMRLANLLRKPPEAGRVRAVVPERQQGALPEAVRVRFDWPVLLRAGLRGLGLRPAEFWALTPYELRVMLGEGEAQVPMGRAQLMQLRAAFPDASVRSVANCTGKKGGDQ